MTCFYLLKLAIHKDIFTLEFYGDSIIMINHLLGSIQITCLTLNSVAQQLQEISYLFQRVDYTHIYKENNKEAKRLSKDGLNLDSGCFSLTDLEDGHDLESTVLLQKYIS